GPPGPLPALRPPRDWRLSLRLFALQKRLADNASVVGPHHAATARHASRSATTRLGLRQASIMAGIGCQQSCDTIPYQLPEAIRRWSAHAALRLAHVDKIGRASCRG